MTITSRTPPPHLGRLNDLQIAQLWIQNIAGELHYVAAQDKRGGEWFTYVSEPQQDGKRRCRTKYLEDATVDAALLQFLIALADDGASIRISPSRIRNVKTLASLLLLAVEGGAK